MNNNIPYGALCLHGKKTFIGKKSSYDADGRNVKMTVRVTLHHLVSLIFLNVNFRWTICGSLAYFNPHTCASVSSYIDARASSFPEKKKEETLSDTETTVVAIRKRRLILSHVRKRDSPSISSRPASPKIFYLLPFMYYATRTFARVATTAMYFFLRA